jgi:hypothetical protein
MPIPHDAQTTLIHELVDAAARDLKTYGSADDPNRFAAGQAALRSIDAAARALQEVRAALANELFKFDQPDKGRQSIVIEAPGFVAGNSGPGF